MQCDAFDKFVHVCKIMLITLNFNVPYLYSYLYLELSTCMLRTTTSLKIEWTQCAAGRRHRCNTVNGW